MEGEPGIIPPSVACANADCKVSETGRCIEGLSLDSCPHYGRELDVISEGAGPEIGVDVSPGVRLRGADTLTVSEASRVVRRGVSRIVAIVGPTDSGKTSLIASLYDLFQVGPIGDVAFSGSETLHAFERACHDARAASRRAQPHMVRTPRGEVRFYHLETRGGEAQHTVDLILGDRAGEEYREAADDASVAAKFLEIQRADTITVLVDGQRLSGDGRHNLRSDLLMIMQGLKDGDALGEGARLALVLTKVDLVRESEKAERAIRDFESLFRDVQQIFSGELSDARSFQVAASPRTEAVARGTGVKELLGFWLDSPRRPVLSEVREVAPSRRVFARLQPLEE